VAIEAFPSHHGWTSARDSLSPEEWEAIAIQFRAAVGIVPYNVWKNLTAESKGWVGGLVQERAQRILGNLDTLIPVNLTSTTDRVVFEDMVPVPGQSRDTAYLLRLVDVLRRDKTTKEIP
jgi:hypothetical protein